MIVLDTHVWVWWVHGTADLDVSERATLDDAASEGLGVSIVSCWEVAKPVQYGRLELPEAVEDWVDQALTYPAVTLLVLTPRIVVESTQLPGRFHKDPADQLIVATARVLGARLATADQKLREYAHVQTLPLGV